jgi:hypothetical protein
VAALAGGLLVALAVPAAALIENPGSFTFNESGAVLNIGFVPIQLPAGSMTGQIDANGNITIPDSSLQGTDLPFSQSQIINGLSVSVSGTATFAMGSLTGTLDPGSGAMSLRTSLFASVTLTAALAGVPIYAGTCSAGGSAPAAQLPMTLTTGPPGVPYSQQAGTVTLTANLGNPVVCNPPLPSPLDTFITAPSTQITVPGMTTPILRPGTGPSPGLSVSVSVIPPAVRSVTLSVSSASYTNCVYGSSTSAQLGFPNGACVAAGNPIVVTNGTAPATITVTGADMVPQDGATHWTLPPAPGAFNGCPATPGADQYCETLALSPGPDSGTAQTPQQYLSLANIATCDLTFTGFFGCGAAQPGQASNEFLAMTGPSSSTDASSSFSTTVTWIAS